ncbi:MFS transporter [Leucobacter insecticola]|uniref:MFS transporter n=1 Tax=Leucobacter insecticola TaxID=2714934 RepID=UPI0031379A17
MAYTARESTLTPPPATTSTSAKERRKVVAASIIGTTIEWYDFFIYAFAANLVLAKLFFVPAGEEMMQILSLITIGLSFLFRPLGAFLAGHFGDKLGRRPMLVITLLLMGIATVGIGLLPTYETIGITAPSCSSCFAFCRASPRVASGAAPCS